MRKAGIIVAILVLLVVIAIFAIPPLLDVSHYHGLVQGQLEKALGRPVSFGGMRLSLTPPGMRLESLTIGEDPAFGRGVFASANYVSAQVKLWPLLRREVQVDSLKLSQPRLQLVRNAQGKWNISSLGQKPAAQPPAPAPKTPQPPHPEQPADGFLLSSLTIDGGQVTLVDQQKRYSGVYDNIDLGLEGYAPGRAFDLRLAVHLPGPGAELVELSGKAGPLTQGDLANTPFDGKLQLKEVSLTGVQRVLNSAVLAGIEGVASGNLKIRNQNATLASEGSLKLEQGRIKGVAIDYPITLDYKIADQLAQDLIRIEQATMRLGPTPLALTGTIEAGPTPARLDLRISTRDASLAEIARLAAAFGVAFNPGTKVSGRLNADLHAQGAASRPVLNGALSAANLEITGGELKQPVKADNISVALSPQEVRSNPFTASSGGTRVAVQFAASNYTSAAPRIDATLRTANASLGELLAIANAYGVSAAQGMSGSGTVNLDVHVSGLLKNASDLNLSGNGRLQNASLHTPSLTQALNVRNAEIQFSQNAASLQNLNASIGHTTASGTLTIRNFAAPQLQFTLSADKLDMAEMQRLIASPSAAPQRAQRWSLVPAAWAQGRAAEPSMISRATGKGAVSIGTVQYNELQLKDVHSDVTLDRGVIRMAPLHAAAYGGQVSGSIVLDTRATPTAVTVTTKMDKVDANQLLSSVSNIKQTLYGMLAGNASTDFRLAEGANIAKTLSGSAALDLSKGRIVGMDLLNQLASIGRFVGFNRSPQSFTELLRLTGNFDIVNGVATTRNLSALIPGGSLAADGSVNLADESLAMHLTAVLSKEMSEQVGGTQIGGFMNTALANNRGELVIPVIVSGTMQSPRFAPDVQKIAQMKLQKLLPTANNPGNPASGILGGILGAIGGQPGQRQTQPDRQQQPPSNQADQPQQQQQPNPLGDLMKILEQQKKKKQQQKPPPPPPQ